MIASYGAFANNISVSNFSITGQNAQSHYAMLKFDISWENSWRTSSAPNNWDAAWIFIKYRVNGTGEWQHTWLNNTGHLNPAGSSIETGLLKPDSAFNQTTNPGLGVFIYRDADGTGTFSKNGVQLRWNYEANGVPDAANIDIRVFAIEQVYVPQGSFYVGTGEPEYGTFYKYPTTTNAYYITSENQITVGTSANNLHYNNNYGGSGDQQGPIPAGFPKGYNAFYCMKYEISQQEYVDFLNSLTQSQANSRKYTANDYRYTITGNTVGSYATSNPYVACNYLNWADLSAYLDWCGLRPMTELEFGKSCRGTLPSVPDEYVWGTTSIASSPYTLSDSGMMNENIATNYSTTLGNAAYGSTIPLSGSINGPVRVGIFAANSLNTGRVSSGATYYGIMEMSGNLMERPVSVGNTAGRQFTGLHGNGLLTAAGNADVFNWPDNNGLGACFRGGDRYFASVNLRVSYRLYGATVNYYRDLLGGRGIRTAPVF
jgi:formylglycine-generating enzyme required for sulfatase activity